MSPSDHLNADETFLEAFLAHQRGLYAYLLVLVPRHADAEDLFQQTSMTLWRKRAEFRPGSNFRAWSRQVAFHTVQNFRARHARLRGRVQFDDELIERIAEVTRELDPELDDRRAALDSCLEKLAPRDRNLLELRYARGATIKSVAGAVGRPVQGLYKAMQRIHESLFDCVSRTLRLAEESR